MHGLQTTDSDRMEFLPELRKCITGKTALYIFLETVSHLFGQFFPSSFRVGLWSEIFARKE